MTIIEALSSACFGRLIRPPEQPKTDGEALRELMERRREIEERLDLETGSYHENIRLLVELDEKIALIYREHGKDVSAGSGTELGVPRDDSPETA